MIGLYTIHYYIWVWAARERACDTNRHLTLPRDTATRERASAHADAHRAEDRVFEFLTRVHDDGASPGDASRADS
jgi:hypothetical protein